MEACPAKSNRILTLAITGLLVLVLGLPALMGEGSSEEWFTDVSVDELSDTDGDGANDSVTWYYEADTDSTNPLGVEVTVNITVLDSDWNLVDNNSDTYTIRNTTDEDRYYDFTAEYDDNYTFYFTLDDDENNTEETRIESVYLNGTNTTKNGIINVDVASIDGDDDGVINDLNFFAHTDEEGIGEVTIRLFRDDIQVGSNTTDRWGDAWFWNLSDGDYLWDAWYNDSQLLHEGGECHIEVSLDRGAVGFQYDHDDDGSYDDFAAQVWDDEEEGDPNGYVEVYDENETLIASGNTDNRTSWWDNAFAVYDLAEGNYSFIIYLEESSTQLQNGSFYSYGEAPKNDSDEWFEDLYYELSDSNEDGTNDTVTLVYDVDTNVSEMEVEVFWIILDSEDDWMYDDSDEYNETNGTINYRNMSWTAIKEDDYTLRVGLYDENDTLEDSATFWDVHLGKGSPQGGGSDEWFTDIYLELRDGDGDGANDTAVVHFEVDTDNASSIDVDTYLDVYDSEGDWEDGDYDSHTVVNGTEEWRSVSFTATRNDTYDLEVTLEDEDGYLEDYDEFLNVTLNASSDPQGGDSNEWFTDIGHREWDSDGDGLNDTVTVEFEVDTDSVTPVDVDTYLRVYDSNGSLAGWEQESHTVVNGTILYRTLNFTADYNDSYDLEIELYDDEWYLEAYQEYYNITLYARNGSGGGGSDGDVWFEDVFHNTYDAGDDGLNDTAKFVYDVDTNRNETPVSVQLEVYNSSFELVVTYYDNFTAENGTIEYRSLEYGATFNDTFYFDLILYDREGNREDDYFVSEQLNATDEVNQAPNATIESAEPDPAVEGQEVTLDGDSTDEDGSVELYRWSSDLDGALGNGELLKLTNLSVGTHKISLEVRDNEGAWSDPANTTLRVHERPIAEILDISPKEAKVGQTVTFEGEGSDDGSIAAYQWAFNGTEVSSSATFTRDDLTAGLYNVSFRVKDNDGAWSDWEYDTLAVNELDNEAPQATIISITPANPTEGDTITFKGGGTDEDGQVVAYLWKLNGVQMADTANFTSSSIQAGTYTVELLVKDDEGAWSAPDSASLTVKAANQKPTAEIVDIFPNPAKERAQVAFTGSGSDNDGRIEAYEWEIDGLEASADTFFTRNDLTVGNHTVKFRVQDNDGAWSDWVTATLQIVADEPPDSDDDDSPGPGLMVSALLVAGLALALRRKRAK